MKKIKMPRPRLPSVDEMKTFLDAWNYWLELEERGELIGEYSPSWWLNEGIDKKMLFFKWVVHENLLKNSQG